MSTYRVTVFLKSESDKRGRIRSYECSCFAEAIELTAAFDMYPDTVSIRVDEIKSVETDISDIFSKLDKINIGDCDD